MAKFVRRPSAELAAIIVPGEEERVGNLATKLARHVDELDQTDNRRLGDGETLTSDNAAAFGFNKLRLSVNHQAERAPNGNHGQWLERGVKCQAAHNAVKLPSELT